MFIWKKVGPAGRVTLPSQKGNPARRVTLLPEPTFCFSCKRFANFCKEMYEKLARPGKLGQAGEPSTQDNVSPYKRGLIGVMNIKIEICIVVLLLALTPKAAQRFNQRCFCFNLLSYTKLISGRSPQASSL